MSYGCLFALGKELFSWVEHSVIEEHNFIGKAGAHKGLIGKTGEKPARSRHCNAEQIQQKSLRKLGRLEARGSRVRRTACFVSPFDLRAMGRCVFIKPISVACLESTLSARWIFFCIPAGR